MRLSRKIVTILLLLMPVVLPTVSSQNYATVTTVMQTAETNSNLVGTTTITTNSVNVIDSETFTLRNLSSNGCGQYYSTTYDAVRGEQVQGSITSDLPIEFYLLSKSDWTAGMGEGGASDMFEGCQVFHYRIAIRATRSHTFDYLTPSDGEYYFVIFYTGTGSANVTLTAKGMSTITTQSGIYSMITNTATVTETISTVQQTYSGTNLILIPLLVAATIATAYLLSRRKKTIRNIKQERTLPVCKQCGTELSRKAKFCRECGAKLP